MQVLRLKVLCPAVTSDVPRIELAATVSAFDFPAPVQAVDTEPQQKHKCCVYESSIAVD
jgi:hypothetical protein